MRTIRPDAGTLWKGFTRGRRGKTSCPHPRSCRCHRHRHRKSKVIVVLLLLTDWDSPDCSSDYTTSSVAVFCGGESLEKTSYDPVHLGRFGTRADAWMLAAAATAADATPCLDSID
jgi:hypothetical protein